MQKPFSLAVALLTLAGLLPFLGSAFVALYPEDFASLLKRDVDGARMIGLLGRVSLLGYGAVIVSFMTGIRWGSELSSPNPHLHPLTMSLATLPAILAWAALAIGLISGNWMSGAMFILAGCLLMILAWDLIEDHASWYMQLRVIATLMACACLIAVAFSVLPPSVPSGHM